MPIIFNTTRTDRLQIRPVSHQDLDDLMAINGDQAVTRYLPYKTWQPEQDAHAWLTRMTVLADEGKALQLVVERQSDNQVIGAILLFDYDEYNNRLEIGYVLGQEYWQQGYAKEAMHGLLFQLINESGLRRIEAQVNPNNIASVALMKSLGFKNEGYLRERWAAEEGPYDVIMFGLLSSDLTWQKIDSINETFCQFRSSERLQQSKAT